MDDKADVLNQLLAQHNEPILADAAMLLFWRNRFKDSTFSVEVTREDITAFRQCVDYLGVEPQIRVFRPQGAPATEGSPRTATRSAVPARPATPPKDYVVIQMVDQDGNAIVPIENNEGDLARSNEARRIQDIRTGAPRLADQLQADMNMNISSNETITRAIEALRVLGRA